MVWYKDNSGNEYHGVATKNIVSWVCMICQEIMEKLPMIQMMNILLMDVFKKGVGTM